MRTRLIVCGCLAQLCWAMPSAAAIELLHNAFLVHDDVEDESDERRSRPTLHVLHGVHRQRALRPVAAVERELRLPEGEQRCTAEQLQLASAASPARADSAAGEAVDRLPVGETERAGAGLGRLDHGLRHEHPLARLEAAGLEHPIRCFPAGHDAITIGEG